MHDWKRTCDTTTTQFSQRRLRQRETCKFIWELNSYWRTSFSLQIVQYVIREILNFIVGGKIGVFGQN